LKRAAKEYCPGRWCLPGGKIGYGETVEQAVKRELFEETSLVCNAMRFIFHQDSLPLEAGGMHCINLYLECNVDGTIKLNEESSQFAWISQDELEKIGLRVINLERMFNVREGLRREDDKLPERLTDEPLPDGPHKGSTVPLDKLLDEGYQAFGWDKITGIPTVNTLKELGLLKLCT